MGVDSTKLSCLLVPVHFQYVRNFFQDGTRRKLNRDLFSHNICRPEHDHENEADKDSVNTYVIHHNFQVNS